MHPTTAKKKPNAATAAPLEKLLTAAEVAELLGITEGTLERWRCYGQGPICVKIGGAARYRPSDIAAYVAKCPTIGGTDAA